MKQNRNSKGQFKKSPRKKVSSKTPNERSYAEIIANAGSDWVTSGIGIDAELFQNVFGLRAAMRDLWRSNPYLAKYQEQLAANVFGEAGIMLRSKIKETEDRVAYAADEKWALIAHEERINRIRVWAEKKTNTKIEQYRALHLADRLAERSHEAIVRGKAMVEVGAMDVYANQRVESWWRDWQRAEVCDVRGRRDYNMLRQLRLWSCARDGGHFIRLIKYRNVNAFGFAIQQISDEWVDHFYNEELPNGNVVRMGIEYPMTSWGLGRPVAYYFIRRMPRDWQTYRTGHGVGAWQGTRDRVDAAEIIHYARFVDTESTRPAPWGVSMLGKVRQLDQYEVAEVVAARREACSTGWLYSDVNPEGGVMTPDPRTGAAGINVTPGGLYGLPWGVKYQSDHPAHPSGNFQNFRQGMGQAACAGLPGADYNIIFNDLANINFSAGRLGRLDTNEINKMLQRFDVETAERPIFEAGLEMALIIGAIPLPLSKYAKFNKPHFQGRRWEQVDETKAIQAAALRIANKLSSRGKECAERGIDFEDNAFELAEEDMFLEQLGLRQETTAQEPMPVETPTEETTDTEDTNAPESSADTASAAETGAIQGTGLNGAQIAGLLAIVMQFTTGAISLESCNAIIAASFPLMTPEEINGITASLTVQIQEETDAANEAAEGVGENTNGKHAPALDLPERIILVP